MLDPEPINPIMVPLWRRVLRPKLWQRAAATIAAVVIAVAVLFWAGSGGEPERSVAQQWNDAIKRLSIEPVYPPVEDIAVGDLLAMITEDSVDDIASEPFAGRSLKLLHIDLTADIEKTYRDTYQFPDTAERPASDSRVWSQTSATESLFKAPDTRKALPLVVFPGFTITRTRGAGAAGGLSQLWHTTFGAAANSSEAVDVKISAAETYGIPALIAEGHLLQFCTNASTQAFCSDAGLRQQLSIVVGSKIYDKIRNEKTGKERPRLSVEIGLINRVFLTRSIETSIRRDSAITGEARTTLSPPPQAPDQPPGAASNADQRGVSPVQRQLQDQHNQLAADEQRTSSGASTSIRSGSSSNVTLPPTLLQRPVVIGFKSVRWMPQRSP